MAKLTNNKNNFTKRSQKLTDKVGGLGFEAKKLIDNRKERSFKFALTGSLDNEFCFKKMRPDHVKEFHKFIDEILSKRMTISQVDNSFLRTKGGVSEKEEVFGKTRDIIHYGKKSSQFRIHGYFNGEGYFVIYQIDPKHLKHKS